MVFQLGGMMRNVENIQILELFVHILDNRAPDLNLSDFPIQLQGNQALTDYFTGHIRTALREPTAKAARFQNLNPDQASGICSAIMSGQTTLTIGSKRIAECLYEIIRTDQRITPADLGVCLYQDQANPGNRYLAILKIDPSEVFQHVITRDANGTRIDYRISENALTKEKLQKCAFIRPLDPRHPEYDLLLLDRQTGIVGDGLIAQYFAQRFLDTVDALDAAKRTNIFYRTVVDSVNQIRGTLPPTYSQEIDQRLTTAVSGRSINVENWLEELPVDEPTRDHLRQAIRQNITDIEFQTDPQIGARLTAKVFYVGDHGFRLSIPSIYYDELVLPVQKIQTPEGEMNEIIIHTRTWSRVPR
jgi:hypothetical protein